MLDSYKINLFKFRTFYSSELKNFSKNLNISVEEIALSLLKEIYIQNDLKRSNFINCTNYFILNADSLDSLEEAITFNNVLSLIGLNIIFFMRIKRIKELEILLDKQYTIFNKSIFINPVKITNIDKNYLKLIKILNIEPLTSILLNSDKSKLEDCKTIYKNILDISERKTEQYFKYLKHSFKGCK